MYNDYRNYDEFFKKREFGYCCSVIHNYLMSYADL